MPIVLAVLNPKGGSGKSTLSTNLARGIQLAGHAVLVLDLDDQGTATRWREEAGDESPMPTVVRVQPSALRDVSKIGAEYDFVVMDGAAKVARVTGAAVRAADLVLVPVRPTPADLWAVRELVDACLETETPAAFVVSQQVTGTAEVDDVDDALVDLGLPVLAGRTTLRVAYGRAMITGQSVLDYEPSGKAAAEIQAIVDEVIAAFAD